MGDKPNKQHYVSRVYLKQFQIDDDQNKSFIYGIDTSNKYRNKIQKFGLNDTVFKLKKYYNHTYFENPYALEEVFGKEIEPTYQNVINSLGKEGKLLREVKEQILEWIFVSKMRSPIFRDNHEDKLQFFRKVVKQHKGEEITEEDEKEIKEKAKWGHLSTFIDEEKLKRMIDLFFGTLNAKHWKVLKAPDNFPFLGCDNPGFSPNVHPLFQEQFPFHHVTELNVNSVIYYVFSPRYCLEIRPFEFDTPLTDCALDMDVVFEDAPIEYITFINTGTIYTSYKVFFSNISTQLTTFTGKKL
ncbi:hypothetical protein GCM10028806_56060 [Spirosoma terrae]|uniref:DUF4238 domain-containing protein n=1 Tax=Spirosoma terrae TaxID=1968276 RepID=A0A6L9LFE9_9BACT|nr:DUF4238 domain-containing protein [Spirosoma terrae]NDU99224.1 DUF4238 domain-containing protein [Spirosoma terrae]